MLTLVPCDKALLLLLLLPWLFVVATEHEDDDEIEDEDVGTAIHESLLDLNLAINGDFDLKKGSYASHSILLTKNLIFFLSPFIYL